MGDAKTPLSPTAAAAPPVTDARGTRAPIHARCANPRTATAALAYRRMATRAPLVSQRRGLGVWQPQVTGLRAARPSLLGVGLRTLARSHAALLPARQASAALR